MLKPMILLGCASVLLGCARIPPSVAPVAPPVPALEAESPAAFQDREARFLRHLAVADSRLAARIGVIPTEEELRAVGMRAVLAEDRDGRLLGNALDPFALDARVRELGAAYRATLGTAPPACVRGPAPCPGARGLELHLMNRMYHAEIERAAIERNLAEAGAALLLAVPAFLKGVSAPEELAARDAWLAERLGDLSDAVLAQKVDTMHRRELADALDPVERLADPARFPRSTVALTRLRDGVGEARMMGEAGLAPSPGPLGEIRLVARLTELLSEPRSPSAIEAELVAARKALGAQARDALSSLPEREADRVRADAASRLALRAPCKHHVAGSAVRSLAAPPEREPGCLAVHALAEARSRAGLAQALVVLHDQVSVALWSVAFHGGIEPLGAARGKYTLLALPEAGDRTHGALLRRAALQPAEAIGAGLVAALTVRNGASPTAERAEAIVRLGDAPPHVLGLELAHEAR